MYAGWVEYFTPAERREILAAASLPESPIATLYRAAPSQDPLDAMQQTDLCSFLPGNLLAYGDAMSMAHALELRLPLLDHRLVAAVGDLAPALRVANGPKTLLKAMAARLLPRSILERPKRGFNPPMGVWLRGDLAPLRRGAAAPREFRAARHRLAGGASGCSTSIGAAFATMRSRSGRCSSSICGASARASTA